MVANAAQDVELAWRLFGDLKESLLLQGKGRFILRMQRVLVPADRER
jgi:hypothetical protein